MTAAGSGLRIHARIPLGDDGEAGRPRALGATAGVRDVDIGFDAIAAEAGRLAGAETVSIARMDRNSNLIIGSWRRVGEAPAHVRVPLAEAPLACRAFLTGHAARSDGELAHLPSVCRCWRAVSRGASSRWREIALAWPTTGNARSGTLSVGLARAIAHDAEQRALHGASDPAVSDQTAALLRVATLVARSRGSQEVFETIAEEVGRALERPDRERRPLRS